MLSDDDEPTADRTAYVAPIVILPVPSPTNLMTVPALVATRASVVLPPALLIQVVILRGPPGTIVAGSFGVKFPLPAPSRTRSSLPCECTTAISCLPSRLKSATASDAGLAPTPTVTPGVKLPVPL